MSELALLGGSKTITLDYMAMATAPVCSLEGRKRVNELMEKGEISQSPVVAEFTERFVAYTGSSFALCTNNGTAALDSALFAVGVRPGDEVIVPSYTFWASVTPIIAQHGIPVFCDVDPQTFCLDPADMEQRITPRTRAVMVVHVWGNPCDMDAILEIAKHHGLAVIEDCSHAHGALYKGKSVGTLGDIGCFSLQGSKTLPAGEGGILVTNNRTYYERAAALGHYELIPSFEKESPYHRFELTGMGHKYRIHPFAAALALSQLDELNARNAIRRSNAELLDAGIADIPFIAKQRELPEAHRVFSYQYYRYVPVTDNPTETFVFLKALHAEGVLCGYCGYGRLHYAPLFTEGGPYGNCVPQQKSSGPALPVTEMLAATTFLAAPRFETSCTPLVEQYIAAYRKVATHMDELHRYAKTHDFSEELARLSGRSIAML